MSQRLAASLQLLKSLFPAQSVPKGQSLILVRTSAGSLVVEYEVSDGGVTGGEPAAELIGRQGRVLGEVRDQWIAREIMLAYFADKDVISPKVSRSFIQRRRLFAHPAPQLKEDVAVGLEELTKR